MTRTAPRSIMQRYSIGYQLEDLDVLNFNKLIQICASVDRGFDIHLERTRKNHYPGTGIIEARLAWKRKLLKVMVQKLALAEAFEEQQ